MTLFQNAIGAYFKSSEAVQISHLYGTLAFIVAGFDETDKLN